MHLILRNSDPHDPEEIEVTGSLFAVGRNEPPFNDYDRKKVARLSKRHARIFEQLGRIYVADLGSTNGTYLNGSRLEREPARIVHGDRVSFGGLDYEVSVLDQADADAQEPRLALTPEVNQDVLEPLLITSFPFLVNQQGPEFSRYREALAEPLSFISRRHAHFFVRDGAVQIEDLGSTNGTYVSGERLAEQARTLEDGDTVAFGGDQFSYRVHLLASAEDAGGQTTEALGDLDVDRTIFIDSPTNFVDIYVGSADPPGADEDGGFEHPDTGSASRSAPARPGFVAQLAEALFGDAQVPRALKSGLLLAVMAIAAALTWWWWSGRELREISRSFDDGHYRATVLAADRQLLSDPADTETRRLGADAARLLTVPTWLEHMQAGAFEEATALAAANAALSPGNPDDDALYALLDWIGRARRAVTVREPGDLDARLEHLSELTDLSQWWLNGEPEHERELTRIARTAPGLEAVDSLALNTWRRLQRLLAEQDVLQQLEASLAAALANRDTTALIGTIDEYGAATGDGPAVTELRADAAAMSEVFYLLKEARPFSAHAAASSAEWRTRPFRDRAAALTGAALPDAESAATFQAAARAWHDGEVGSAQTLLSELLDTPWAAEVRAEQARHTELLRRREALNADPDQTDELLALYRSLDPSRDGFLIASLEPAYLDALAEHGSRADEHLTRAAERWHQYQRVGGIGQSDRMAASVTTRFRERSELLMDSLKAIRQAETVLERVGAPGNGQLAALSGQVCSEIDAQRDRLEPLLGLQGREVGLTKLELLPARCP